ncbi:toll/interleukin-1 receptor domain-containing protein [Pseudomonas sp. LS1212]|uniref:toll/interleukin-1 receptor domain-containing protein n=1 Tax=Pseudomonas sp. LS1212 TaxID=2972478 RepID=UPI00215BE576|nr:toll/interleukin-1 receptor domain-containing protein [Pseudomonas sp. LS1212]UVJ42657.1 toll/interleukin-1 receptor domain-containing protein [Pseudomonas sp. LS1212]
MRQGEASTLRGSGPYLVRAVWIALILAALAGHVWLARLPFPLDVGRAPPFAAAPGERLVLIVPSSATPLIRYEGRPGEAVDVRFERARLKPETLALLRSAGLDPPSGEEALEWLSEDAGNARTFLTVNLLPPAAGKEARVELFQLPEAERGRPYFELRAQGADLSLTMAAPDADPFAAAAPMRHLTAGGRSWALPAALPLHLLVTDGQSLRVRVVSRAAAAASASPAGRFVFGAGDGSGALPLRAAGVSSGGGANASLRQFACSAPPQGPYWPGAGRLAEGICDRGPSVPALTATQLEVSPDALAMTLRGTAWIAREGVEINAPLINRVRAEPTLVAAIVAADLALALGAGLPLYRALRRRRGEHAPGIFISYRRVDSIAYARLIADGLAEYFGAERVFIDLEDIQPGERFLQRITDTLARCRAVVVLIGPGWLTAARDGQRRLDDPKDIVRHEIVQALTLQLDVVPVLVGGTTLPRPQDLPAELASLLEHSALEISDVRLKEDIACLAKALQSIVNPAEQDEE